MRRAVLALAVAVAAVLVAAQLAAGAFTTHRSNPQDFVAASAPPTPEQSLVAQSRSNDGGATASQVQLGLRLRNTGTTAVPLASVTMRYWFTANGATDLVTACYYATLGCGNLRLGLTRLPVQRDGATHYLQVSFPGGSLAAGADASLEQLAFRDQTGTAMTQGDDHSFLGTGSFADNAKVTVYVDGTRVWGTEPGDLPETQSVEVQYVDLDGALHDPQVKPGLKVVNTGTTDLDLSSLTLRYWFTKDSGDGKFQGFCDYAQIGCSAVRTGFGTVQPARPGADSYFEVGFSAGTLGAEAATGPIQLRFSKVDYSVFDETNDHSHAANTAFATTTTVTAYLGGKLVWGTEP